jgi:predicted Zn finger-like uncharacterized protein
MSDTKHRPSRPDTQRCRSGDLEILIDCPSCRAQIRFAPNGRGPSRRLFARCGACGTGYTLFGGQLSEVPPRTPVGRGT